MTRTSIRKALGSGLLDPPAHRLTAIKVKLGESPISDIGFAVEAYVAAGIVIGCGLIALATYLKP